MASREEHGRARQDVEDAPAPRESRVVTERASLVVRPGIALSVLIVSCALAGLAIFWLLRTMHI